MSRIEQGCSGWVLWLVGLLGLVVWGWLPGLVLAAEGEAGGSPAQQRVKLSAGEQYLITGLSPEATPEVRVIKNGQALMVHGEKPGELLLLGVERGEWQITVERQDGERVRYDVVVDALASPFKHPLRPGAMPTPLPMGWGAAGGAALGSAGGAGGAAGASAGSEAESERAVGGAAGGGVAVGLGSRAGELSGGLSGFGAAPSAAEGMAPAPAASLPAAVSAAGAGANSPGAGGPGSAGVMAGGLAQVGRLRSQEAVPAPLSAGDKRHFFRSDPLAEIPAALPAPPAPAGRRYLPADGLTLRVGSSRIFDFPRRLVRVAVASTKVADVAVVTPYEISVSGKQPGFTTLTVWDDRGEYTERQVRVEQAGRQQVMLDVTVAELNLSRLENQGTNFSTALSNMGMSLVSMPGAVATSYSPAANIVAQGIAGVGAAAIMPPPGVLPAQGQLINLLLSPNITYGLAAGNSAVQNQAFFQYLEQHQLGKILAEPKILANSGEKAQFLSGGEIPIVIAQALNTSIVFKQFGTSVVFLPTVVGRDEVELSVEPEVSQPDYVHGVQMFGFTVPAFVTRRAKTQVRLRNRQTLIIAGLILETITSQVNKVPYLGDMPFAGGLFRTTSYQRQKTNLVMSVTPEIVSPLPPNAEVFLPPNSRGPLTPEEIQTQRLAVPDASRPRF